MILDGAKNYALLALAAACAVLGLSTCSYKKLNAANSLALKTQGEAIKARNREAEQKLDRLTEERDVLQAKLNKSYEDQEKKDAETKVALDAAARAAADQPVRVRFIPVPRSGGGSPAGQATAAAQCGDAAPSQAAGVLPPANARRLGEVIAEMEQINAAYATCRATLLKE